MASLGMFDMQGKYKWDAWKKNEGMSKEKAQEEYVKYFFTVSLQGFRGNQALIITTPRCWTRTLERRPTPSRLESTVSSTVRRSGPPI